MALSSSNTFVLPSSSSSLVNSRDQFNSSLKAILQNFYGPARPDTENFKESGTSMPEADFTGVLYRSSNTGMLYISDPNVPLSGDKNRTNYPIGGNFTRYGLAWRQEVDLVSAAANLSTYDIGEAFVIVNNTNGGPAGNRMYLRVSDSTNASVAFKDVGSNPPGAVSYSGDINVADGNITVSGSSVYNRDITVVNTSAESTAQARLVVKAGTTSQGWAFGQNKSDKSAFIYSPDKANFVIAPYSNEALRINSEGNVIVNWNIIPGVENLPFKLVVGGSTLIRKYEPSNGTTLTTRNPTYALWDDKLYGMELGYNTTLSSWTTRLHTRDGGDGDRGSLEFGVYPYGSNTAAVNAFSSWMTLSHPGNVGIGVSRANTRLHVLGTIYATADVRAGGDVTAYYSSDIKLKENIKNISNPLEKINSIRGVEFDWTDEYMKQHGGEDGYFIRKHDVGVIAQEIERILPEVVIDRADGIKAVKYDRIVALLIEAIKELKSEIDILKGK